ncbi:MAG: sugar phosphate isomerase/epimerase, partial [Chloracidobacterium sp.]|nr:sugar phosphate isomerase/epimerase [Chloracidobacterium sp.]
NAPEHRLLPGDYDWSDKELLYEALGKMTGALRRRVKDFHVAQNDATVKGSGSHDKTGRHCLPNDPNGKMDIVRAAGLWLRDENGELTRNTQHVNWDGCMFSNETMLNPQTWRDILSTMVAVRNAHGWN